MGKITIRHEEFLVNVKEMIRANLGFLKLMRLLFYMWSSQGFLNLQPLIDSLRNAVSTTLPEAF